MLTYRTFSNFDPPRLAALWQSLADRPGLAQPVSPDLLEQLLFAKLYFDPKGLMLAFDESELVGFAHAGFGPSPDRKWIATDTGVICAVVVKPGAAEREVANGLIERCEEYLRARGAKTIQGGGLSPVDPFYVGLYGGSELPGILDSDVVVRDVFAARGYQETDRTVLMHCELRGFESTVDRRQMQARRQMLVEVAADAPTHSSWEASVIGEFDLTRFDLVPRVGGPPVATVVFRAIEAAGHASVTRSVGLLGIAVAESHRRRGLAIFVLCEAFRQFLRDGVISVETQTKQNDKVSLDMFHRLGFQEVGHGGVWKKS